MKKFAPGKFPALFWLLTIADTVGIYSNIALVHIFVKPLLIPSLMLGLYFSHIKAKGENIIFAALFFSFLGDVFLLFENNNPLFFIAGLSGFLITHICYIVFFLGIKPVIISLLKKQPLLVLMVLGYGTWLICFLYPHLGKLKLPVIIYAFTICTMLLCSLHIFLSVNKPANKYYVLGAASFVLSDSILAMHHQ